MSYTNRLNALILATALLAAPCLSADAFAHEHAGWGGSEDSAKCGQGHLSEAQRKLLEETMHKFHEEHRQALDSMYKLHESLHKVLNAQPFDKNAFLSIEAQIEQQHMQIERSRAEIFASIAGQFTPEQRQHLVHMLKHHHHHDEMHHEGMHHRDGHAAWHHHEEHENWSHSSDRDESPTTIGQYHNDGYPPYAPR